MPNYSDLLGLMGLIIATVGIILTLESRRKKSIKYDIISETPLFDIRNLENQIRENLRTLFYQKKIANLYLFMIRFINDGDLPISRDDFKRPIIIEFNQQARILRDPEIDDSNPKDILLRADVVSDNRIEIRPELINSKEWFILKILLTEYQDYNISARVVGIKKIKKYEPSVLTKKTLFYASFSALLGLFSAILISERIGEIFYEISFSIHIMLFLVLYFTLVAGFHLFLENIIKSISNIQSKRKDK